MRDTGNTKKKRLRSGVVGQKGVGYVGWSELFRRTSRHRSRRRALQTERMARAKSSKLGTERNQQVEEVSGVR